MVKKVNQPLHGLNSLHLRISGMFTTTTFIQRVQQGNGVPLDEFEEFSPAMCLFSDLARIGLISLSDEDFSAGKFVVPGKISLIVYSYTNSNESK